jgi:hypothetical protein
LQQVYDMLPVLARLLEVHAMHYTALSAIYAKFTADLQRL